jgi:nicotinamide-nucleotide amidase
MLGVPAQLIEDHGVVSEACARSMAEGAIARSRADLAVSITGFAEAAPGQPGGLVHFACARRGAPTRHRVERFGDVGRAEVRLAALRVALTLLHEGLSALAAAAPAA